MQYPDPLTPAQLERLNEADLAELEARLRHPSVCWHPEAKAVGLALLAALRREPTVADWVSPFIEACRAELGSFGPNTPADLRALKRDRAEWKARAVRAQEEHVARLAASVTHGSQETEGGARPLPVKTYPLSAILDAP